MDNPTVLIIMDGWGLAPPGPGNAITQSKLTVIPRLWNTYPHTTLAASGLAVGLLEGEMGNTETGHLNIGAGRIVNQDLVRINHAIFDGSFVKNQAFSSAITHAITHGSNLHIMGLFSSAGVHASREHLCSILTLCKEKQINNVYLHLFTDGRDSPPQSSLKFFEEFHPMCTSFPFAHVATIMGRYYAMDRDKRWERTESAYIALTEGSQYTAKFLEEAITYAYQRGETDEFIKPTVILDPAGNPYPRISDNDAVIFYNYRIDRPRQLTRAFVMPDFETKYTSFSFDPYAVKYYKKHIVQDIEERKPFIRKKVLKNLFFVTMTEYERDVPCVVAFPPLTIRSSFGEMIANADIRQLRMSESEKERFVTYYFNGMREEKFPGEDRLIIPSPKVPTYDLAPEMSAIQLTDQLIDRLSLGVYGFIVLNFANPDMVGHTGNIAAAIKACETVDACVGRIVTSVLQKNGSCVITADHGNVEEMLNAKGGIDTEHSTFPIPLIIVNQKYMGHFVTLPTGKLGDVAPTILSLMNLPIPADMTGKNIIQDM